MATRMDKDTDTYRTTEVERKPAIWPWVVAAIVVVAIIFWVANRNANNSTDSTSNPNFSAPLPSATPGNGAGTAPSGNPASGTYSR